VENKTYIFTYFEHGKRFPCAAVTKLKDGLARYENFIALVEEVLPVDEAFAKAREKAAMLN
jgi:hypothetical protein|tara:strand:+ start:540 stop:722 length:183 start_codon:yes stop_codon:yes gene_type:complete